MKQITGLSCLLIILLANTGCPKPCVGLHYSFDANIQISPSTDSIRVGDTLYITASFSNSLIDRASGKLINYTNANDIQGSLGIGQLIKDNSVPKDGVADFKYNSVIGLIYNSTITPSSGVQQLKY